MTVATNETRHSHGAIPLYGMALTPFDQRQRLDTDALLSYARRLVRAGCDRLIGLGVIAEPRSLSLEEKLSVIEVLLATGAPVVATVMAGPDEGGAAEVRVLARTFGSRLAGLMVPILSSDAEAARRQLCEAATASGLPIVVQDYPAATGVSIEIEELTRALRGLDAVVSVKEEAGPTFARIRFLRSETGLELMSGLGGASLAHDLLAGANAAACGISSPEVIREALDLWEQGRRSEAEQTVAAISGRISIETQQRTSIAIRKENWRRRGVLASGAVRSPTVPYAEWMSEHVELAGYPEMPK